MARLDFICLRDFCLAPLCRKRAAGMETASARRIARGRQITLKDDTVGVVALARVKRRGSGKQRFRIRMCEMIEDLFLGTHLDDFTKIHDTDRIGDELDDGKVMRDEEICQSEVFLQVFQQVDDL